LLAVAAATPIIWLSVEDSVMNTLICNPRCSENGRRVVLCGSILYNLV
jgi:hypothetical protein